MSEFKPIDYRYLFLDMNSFFASCEQQFEPKLRGKPMVVAPYTGPSGCCIAVSRQARLLGIKTGMGVGEAKAIFPNLIVVESRPSLYMKVHQKLIDILGGFSPWLKVRSIDEVAIPLSPIERNERSVADIADDLKKNIRSRLGEYLTASIGVGPNIFLAKQAAESQKPDGFTIMCLTDIERFMAGWQLTDLKGINFGMERRLKNIGIYSALEFYHSPASFLSHQLGLVGEYWYLRLHGFPVDNPPVKTQKNLSQSHVLPPEYRAHKQATKVLRKLVERAACRLRADNLWASRVDLFVYTVEKRTFFVSRKTAPFQDAFTFWQEIESLWNNLSINCRPFKLAINASELTTTKNIQRSLFIESPKDKQQQLAHIIDGINYKFGQNSTIPASLIRSDKIAPARISFGAPKVQDFFTRRVGASSN